MPIIYGETARGVRLVPALSGQQALELLATGAIAWFSSRVPAPGWFRLVAATLIILSGFAFTVVRWPFGPSGERLATWARRVAAYVHSRRRLAGTSVPGWDGVHDICQGRIHHAAGWAAVMEWSGGDPTLRGVGSTEAAQGIYRELLHALPGSLQVIGLVRGITPADRPPAWQPETARPALAVAARAYADHWEALVQTHTLTVRRTLLVVTVPGWPREAFPQLDVAMTAVAQCAVRLGLSVRRVQGAELTALLRAEAAAVDVRPGPDADAAPVAVIGDA